jgi:predicted TIM-barrel fold metal-dependent hydrolase
MVPMPYVSNRRVLDADAHLMEPKGWLEGYVEPAFRADVPPMAGDDQEFDELLDSAVAAFALRSSSGDEAAAARRELMTMPRKGWVAYGAIDATERSSALDELGFACQVIYPTGAFPQVVASPAHAQVAAAMGMNRGLAEFCADDPRLLPTAYIPLHHGIDEALRVLDDAIARDVPVVMVDMLPAKGAKGITHHEHDPLWARIVDADLVLSVHIGLDNGWRPVRREVFDNGRELPHFRSDAPGDAVSYMAIGFPAQLWLASLVFDGVLERFPGLRLLVAELGAVWVPGFLQHLDQAHRAFKRLQDLSELTMAPSDYVRRQVTFTPFAGEPVGWMIGASSPELYAFSSDYPHHEGSDDPVKRFDASMPDVDDAAREAFYSGNLERILGSRLPSVAR